ncbi:MAG: glutamine synthetase beta-grasp domain-containing protein [Bacteriovoracaceae bacterium]|nr:glutamine synthetase beta-grasp domain-containing protein [Bacteriovoracaceae bacterium]
MSEFDDSFVGNGVPSMNVATLLSKGSEAIQRSDLLQIISDLGLVQINLNYIGLDGKIKELKVPINDLDHAELVLALGERLDGSSVFKGIVETGQSDLYIVPIYKSAFISPFDEDTLGVFCRFLNKKGELATYVPENILYSAHNDFKKRTGSTLNAMGELEFYLIYDKEDILFTGLEQRGYHQTAPFSKCSAIVNEMLRIMAALTGAVKYAHSEVGFIDVIKSDDPEINGKSCEQFEIELLPSAIDEMAYHIALGKWVIRNIAHKWGCSVTFSPKLEEGMAGSGLHFHLEVCKDGKNLMVTDKGELSEVSKRLIGGLCKYSSSLTAFGNTVSSAYLRLVANQEAPTRICWSCQNRHALIRVPLGWNNVGNMAKLVNPAEESQYTDPKGSRQTVELRSPDGSAHVSMILAGITAAAIWGLTSDESLEVADKYYVEKFAGQELENIPASCFESAVAIEKDRDFYESVGFFPVNVIDWVIKELKNEKDGKLNEEFMTLSADKRLKETRKLMHKDLHKQ